MTDVINENENNQALPEEEVDITVVDNGQTYESQESAIVAKDEADRAKLWAEESERQANLASASAITAADAKDDAVAAKNYAESAANLAQNWAIKTNGTVDGSEYSSKYYAQQANTYAQSINPDNIVHITGAETITGAKTFDVNITKKSAIPYTSAPSETTWDSVDFKDSNNNWGGRLVHATSTDGSQSIGLYITNPIYNGTTNLDWESIGIRRTSTGNTYGYCPTPTDIYSATSSEQMTNVGWVASNFVNLAGAQTISGAKIYTNVIYSTRTDADDICFSIKDTNVSVSSNPSAQGTRRIRFTDKDNNRLTEIQSSKNTSGKTTLGLLASNTVNGVDINAIMSIHVEADGTKSTTCPASDVVDSIVTTLNKTKSGNGYYELGNGLILQWGNVSQNTNTTGTITFPKPFVNGYKCVAVGNSSSTFVWLTGDTNTAITWNKTSATSQIKWIAIGC